MMNEKDRFYLKNILDMILDIEKFLSGMDEPSFMASDLHLNAVAKKLENIGEAAKRLSDKTKGSHPDVAWKKAAGMRDILIHDYLGIDASEVWKTAKTDLPVLKKQVKRLLSE